MRAVLEVNNVRKSFGRFDALSGVSLVVEEGELFGLLGPNGAGKTTLLSILAGLTDASSGAAHLFGRPLVRSDLTLRPLIGLATQELALYGELSARENLNFFGKLYGLRGGELIRRVDEVLEFTALKERAGDRVANFSGGMKRRLNLGVAVVHRPKILYLDEPTTGVDPQSRHHLFEQIRALNAEGVTVVYTSHYMEEVEALCPRIAIMDHGRVIACDTRTNLLRRLDGTVTFTVSHNAAKVTTHVESLSSVKIQRADGNTLHIQAADVSATTLKVVALLRELNIELTALSTKEPTLEQVFLHLTDAAVRD